MSVPAFLLACSLATIHGKMNYDICFILPMKKSPNVGPIFLYHAATRKLRSASKKPVVRSNNYLLSNILLLPLSPQIAVQLAPTASPTLSASPTLAPTSSAPTNLPTSSAPTNAPITNVRFWNHCKSNTQLRSCFFLIPPLPSSFSRHPLLAPKAPRKERAMLPRPGRIARRFNRSILI